MLTRPGASTGGAGFWSDDGVMAHKRRNGKLLWRNRKANHGVKPSRGKEKSAFDRTFRHKHRNKTSR